MRRIIWKRVAATAVFLALAATMLWFVGRVLRPAHENYGATWSAYRGEPRNTMDVLYLGSSFAYCDFDPVEVYRNSGLTGYVVGASEQTPSISYWYLREALKTQKPQAVVFEVTGVYFGRYMGHTQTNLVYMPASENKLGAIFTAAEPELRTGLLCDLWFYHSRWKEVGLSDLKRAVTPATADHWKGFTGMHGTAQTPKMDRDVRQIEDDQYRENLEWLWKIADLCRDEDIQLVLVTNPTYAQARPEQYRQLAEDVAREAPEALFVHWADSVDDWGLTETDFYDICHLNIQGAGKYAVGVAELLTDELGLSPMPQTEENTRAWQAAVAQRDALA